MVYPYIIVVKDFAYSSFHKRGNVTMIVRTQDAAHHCRMICTKCIPDLQQFRNAENHSNITSDQLCR